MTKDPKLSRSSLGNRLLPRSYTYTKQLTTCSSIGESVPSPIASRWCERDSTIWEREQELDARARVRRAACCLLRKRQGFRNHDEKLTVPPSTTVPNDQTADDTRQQRPFQIYNQPTTVPRFRSDSQRRSERPDSRRQVPTLQSADDSSDFTVQFSSERSDSRRQFRVSKQQSTILNDPTVSGPFRQLCYLNQT
jgi:hypothetical protein